MKVSRIHRLLRLITLLQTGRRYQPQDLVDELKVSRRTVFRDLNLLKAARIPLTYDDDAHSYKIEKSFFLPPVNFSVPEVLGLMMALEKYGSRAALPNFEAVAGAMLKIESTLPRDMRDYCGSAIEHIEVRHPPMSDARQRTRVFELLWKAARHHEIIEMDYDSYYEGQQIHTLIHPYRLMFFARGWYVIGYSTTHNETRTFKLERIIATTPTGRPFRADAEFDPAAYFGNAWQMIRGDHTYHVRIRFSPKVAGNVEEILWHPTQRTDRLDDHSLMYEVDVDGVEEIAWWVLGYGKEAVVLSPPRLRRIILEHTRAMTAAYEGSQRQE